MKRKIKIGILLFILLLIYIYISSISLFPKSIILMQGESLNLATLWGINVNEVKNTNPILGKYTIDNIFAT